MLPREEFVKVNKLFTRKIWFIKSPEKGLSTFDFICPIYSGLVCSLSSELVPHYAQR